MNVKRIDIKDLPEIVEVHRRCFPNNFSSCIGKKLLRNYYLCCYNDNPALFLAAYNDNKIIGFIVGYTDGGKRVHKRFKRENAIKLVFSMLFRLLIFDKRAWKKVIHKKNIVTYRNEKYIGIDKSKLGSLLSICVISEYRGKNVSAELETAFINELKLINMDHCYLAVESKNDRAIHFYLKQGYEKMSVIGQSVIYIKKI